MAHPGRGGGLLGILMFGAALPLDRVFVAVLEMASSARFPSPVQFWFEVRIVDLY